MFEGMSVKKLLDKMTVKLINALSQNSVKNVCDNKEIYSVEIDEKVVKICEEACAPKTPLPRLIPMVPTNNMRR